MSELSDMAFDLCLKARQRGMERSEILVLVEVALARLETIDVERLPLGKERGGD